MADDSSEIVKEAAETVGFRNVKDTEVTAAPPAFYTGLAMGNAVAHQQAMNQIAQASVGKIVELIMGTSPAEGTTDATIGAILSKLAQGWPSQTKYTEGT